MLRVSMFDMRFPRLSGYALIQLSNSNSLFFAVVFTSLSLFDSFICQITQSSSRLLSRPFKVFPSESYASEQKLLSSR